MRAPSPLGPRPSVTKSSGRIPIPIPTASRPPETPSMAASSFASRGAGHTVASITPHISPIDLVAPAAAASATVSITPG